MKEEIIYDLIGQQIKGIQSLNNCDIGLYGLVVEETKNCIDFLHNTILKTVLKRNVLLMVNQKIIIDGAKINDKVDKRTYLI